MDSFMKIEPSLFIHSLFVSACARTDKSSAVKSYDVDLNAFDYEADFGDGQGTTGSVTNPSEFIGNNFRSS